MRQAGVLRLVHQHMLESAVKLVEHPLGSASVGQQIARPQDKILEIMGAAPLLGGLEVFCDFICKCEKCKRCVNANEIVFCLNERNGAVIF